MEKQTNCVIVSTTNYDKFKIVQGNRSIKQTNVSRLMKSFEKTNGMSMSKPIIVDGNYNVIDGQHRLAACQKMGIPVHYVVTDEKRESIPVYNSCQEKWGMEDYARYFAGEGNKNYERLLMVKDASGCSVHECLEGLGLITSGYFNSSFKEGRFIFEQDIDESVAFLQEIKRLCYIIKGRNSIITKITRAIRVLRKIKTFDFKKFVEKITMYQGKLYNCTTSEEYIEMFVWINNYKTHSENRISTMEILEAKNTKEDKNG